jgi:hypothetical protein
MRKKACNYLAISSRSDPRGPDFLIGSWGGWEFYFGGIISLLQTVIEPLLNTKIETFYSLFG